MKKLFVLVLLWASLTFAQSDPLTLSQGPVLPAGCKPGEIFVVVAGSPAAATPMFCQTQNQWTPFVQTVKVNVQVNASTANAWNDLTNTTWDSLK
ncbi:MAG: hypothetical protein LAP40_24550 [Acidobacteriia bacterium]|nr:hypothetical protein [Terriglobia bacterium]